MSIQTNKQNPSQIQTHKIRTFFASIAGIIAIYLILASVTVIWLNRTLTNTPTYVSTVAPLVKKPAIQNFIAQKVTNQILQNAPTQDLANSLLSPSELSGKPTPNQLKAKLTPIINADVISIVSTESFATLWKNTNTTAHEQLINQLNSNSGEVQLNLNPAITQVVNELKSSKLSSVAPNITVSSTTGNLDIKNSGLKKAHRYYKLFQEGTVAIVVAAILMAALAVWLSVNHAKTIRRILMGVGILALLEVLILEIPQILTLGGTDQTTEGAARAFSAAIFHNLIIANLILGILCIGGAIGSKLYSKHR
jgi:hypothetical protein